MPLPPAQKRRDSLAAAATQSNPADRGEGASNHHHHHTHIRNTDTMATTRVIRCLVAVALCLAISATTVNALSCSVNSKTDCGYVGIDATQCGEKGCCWQESTVSGVPWCFYGDTTVPQWTFENYSTSNTGFTASIYLQNSGAGTYGPALKELSLTATLQHDTARFKLTDPNNARYEIPQSILPDKIVGDNEWQQYYTVKVPATGAAFTLQVVRLVDGVTIFDLADLEYSDQFLQLATNLPEAGSPNLYGIGEHVMNFLLPTNNHTFTLWNADSPTPWDQNIYGSHPFFLQTLADNGGNAHGIFLRNSNGMDIVVTTTQVTFRAIGGVLDVFVFIGPTHTKVMQQYHSMIGFPAVPPYWSLGWHQCKYGWKSIAEVESVVSAYASNQIPLDTIWGDIDYMDAYQDFSWDPVNYPVEKVAAFTEQLHADNQHYVVIVDPGVRNLSGYAPYEQGLSDDIFIKTGDGVTPVIGQVWPGYTAFPDFLAENIVEYWTGQISGFLAQVPYDGLWIDMNEISSFFTGVAYNDDLAVNNPPYAINNGGWHGPLAHNTLPVDAIHANGLLEYDVHNLYGIAEAIATRTVLDNVTQKRAFILTRSTFPGSGAYVAHWLGDNHATWDDLWRSIPGVLNANMYGIPMVGSDICGFIGTTTEELCARWTALGAFYSFSRNHHQPDGDQEPYLWASVMAVAKKVLAMKYSLLPSLYSYFYQISTTGGTVLTPLMFNFPQDLNTYSIDTQFMWSNTLLVTPVLTQGATTVQGYFPTASVWYDLWNGLMQLQPSTNGYQTLPCSIEDAILLHVAGGSILFMQTPALTTAATRLNPFELIVAFSASDNTGVAFGTLFWDDGDNLDMQNNTLSIALSAGLVSTGGSITSTQAENMNYSGSMPSLQTIRLAGMTYQPSSVTSGSTTLPSSAIAYNATSQVVTLTYDFGAFNSGEGINISWTTAAESEESDVRLATE